MISRTGLFGNGCAPAPLLTSRASIAIALNMRMKVPPISDGACDIGAHFIAWTD
jgi:hypothetical protein